METFLHVIQIIAQVVLAGAAGVGAYVALRGLNAWRHQARFNQESPIARRALLATYKVREVIEQERTSNRMDRHLPPDAFRARYDTLRSRMADAMAEVETATFEAEATWDPRVPIALERLRTYALLLLKAVLLLATEAGEEAPVEMPDGGELPAGAVAYAPSKGKPDPFGDGLRDRVAQVEAGAKPRLRPS